MNRFTSVSFVGWKASMSSAAVAQRTNTVTRLPLYSYMYDRDLNYDRGSGRDRRGH
ncbi:hypothetical protein IQ243_15200 [Nostocales cyanobacterium LEGE 11386]|nr:hypothetical protein [Nostocales cyanobacterium LEGE 11386]